MQGLPVLEHKVVEGRGSREAANKQNNTFPKMVLFKTDNVTETRMLTSIVWHCSDYMCSKLLKFTWKFWVIRASLPFFFISPMADMKTLPAFCRRILVASC